jgi:hypothetical protein
MWAPEALGMWCPTETLALLGKELAASDQENSKY